MEDLIERVKAGDNESFNELVKPLEDYLYRFALSKVHNEEDAKDAVQETMIKAYLGIKGLKDTKYFKTWITKILINECKSIYKKKKRNEEFFDETTDVSRITRDFGADAEDHFDELIECLKPDDKKLFCLYYKEEMPIREISKKLDININTIKTHLKRGKEKIRASYKGKAIRRTSSILTIILCVLIATSVVAITIIGYLLKAFNTNSVNENNDGVLSAIEHLDWFQKTDMEYIDLADGYKAKVEYLVLDEMNLYLIFDLYSENDMSKYNEFTIPDLKITNENDSLLYDESNFMITQYTKRAGQKLIEKDKNHIKELIYVYTDSFPLSHSLDINFSKIVLFKTIKDKLKIDANTNFTIDLEDKFINRNYVSYTSDDSIIEKAIVTPTGFYALITMDKSIKYLSSVELIDENNNKYTCFSTSYSSDDTSAKYPYIITANFNDIKCNKLKLCIDNLECDLVKN